MSFVITVCVPFPGERFGESVEELKAQGFHYVPTRKCWVAEYGGFITFAIEVGEFVVDGATQCPFPEACPLDELHDLIDSSCDFKAVGR